MRRKKNKFILIIVLMLVSLLGLVGIQIYWISSVITERTIEFEENATRAIHQITHKLEEEEGEYLLSRFAGLKDFISPGKPRPTTSVPSPAATKPSASVRTFWRRPSPSR